MRWVWLHFPADSPPHRPTQLAYATRLAVKTKSKVRNGFRFHGGVSTHEQLGASSADYTPITYAVLVAVRNVRFGGRHFELLGVRVYFEQMQCNERQEGKFCPPLGDHVTASTDITERFPLVSCSFPLGS
jgi:hypothetical protein